MINAQILIKAGRGALRKILHQSDYKRWTDPDNLQPWWDERTEKIAQLIPKNGRVIEFGAGRRQLEKFLDSSCSYVPSDLTDRGPGTIICDLNRRPLPDLRELAAAVAVFGGVLEYILDLDSLVQWLSSQFSFCVASYTYVNPTPTEPERIRERLKRLHFGFMNNYTEEELVSLFEKYGFTCVKRGTWTTQRLFLFEQRHLAAPTLSSVHIHGTT
jgi:hypothetical protein